MIITQPDRTGEQKPAATGFALIALTAPANIIFFTVKMAPFGHSATVVFAFGLTAAGGHYGVVRVPPLGRTGFGMSGTGRNAEVATVGYPAVVDLKGALSTDYGGRGRQGGLFGVSFVFFIAKLL